MGEPREQEYVTIRHCPHCDGFNDGGNTPIRHYDRNCPRAVAEAGASQSVSGSRTTTEEPPQKDKTP